METKEVGKIIKWIVAKIVNNKFEDIYNEDYNPDYSISELANAIKNHPEIIIEPTDQNLYLDFNFFYLEDNLWKIDFDLYTVNNDKSELTLKLNIREDKNGAYSYTIKDLLVM